MAAIALARDGRDADRISTEIGHLFPQFEDRRQREALARTVVADVNHFPDPQSETPAEVNRQAFLFQQQQQHQRKDQHCESYINSTVSV